MDISANMASTSLNSLAQLFVLLLFFFAAIELAEWLGRSLALLNRMSNVKPLLRNFTQSLPGEGTKQRFFGSG